MRTKIENDKTLANINDLRLWAKNPKISESSDLERLKKQIVELGVYKPLICTEDGTLLGGNQRYKVLKELYKENKEKFEWVWVSVVEAWTEAEMFKYAISDNDIIGKYTREKIMEAIPEFAGQESLFEDYKFDFGVKKNIEEVLNEVNLTEEQIKLKNLEDNLKAAGVNEESIDAALKMSKYHKNIVKLKDVEIEGETLSERFPIPFWCNSKFEYEYLKSIYATNRIYNFNTELLIKITKKYEQEIIEMSSMQ
jgi:hypothetical protein